MACVSSASQALWPGPSGARPTEGERKKFCMSIITRAVLDGSMVIGLVVVERRREGVMGGEDGVGGCVRSKPCRVLCSQKFEDEPSTARWAGVWRSGISASARVRAGADMLGG